ncbi:MAG: helix-turn-helix transcriptional regulator [Oscillospiraceae bacterium]|nr:helix-turn-helix transcriptional regulator [Oscillospiraceae bacterium]
MCDSILLVRDYGAVRLRLRERMDRRGLNRNQVAKRIGVRFEVVDKWYQGEVEKMDLDILARLCFVLDCQPGDLLEYRK